MREREREREEIFFSRFYGTKDEGEERRRRRRRKAHLFFLLFSANPAPNTHTPTHPSLSGSVDKKTVLENLDLALLAIDEVVDRGLILETDPATVAQRASMAGAEGEMGPVGVGGGLSSLAAAGGPLSEQTLSKVMASAKEQLARSLLK